MTFEDGYKAALLDIAKECEDGLAYERERFVSAFPDGDLQHLARASHRGHLLQQYARDLRERAEKHGRQSRLE